MHYFYAFLALVVAVEYTVIAFAVAPRLAREFSHAQERYLVLARWGAVVFFVGSALTHAWIALQNFFPQSVVGINAFGINAKSGISAGVLETVLPLIAQILGGAAFIAIALPLRMTGVFEDITDRRNADAALHASEQRFRQLADGLDVGVVLRQLEPAKVLYANAEYIRIIGFDPTRDDPTQFDSAQQRIPPSDKERVLAGFWAGAQAECRTDTELRTVSPAGVVQWLRVTSNPGLTRDGIVLQRTETIEDITNRKTAEAEVRSARLEAERANLAKSEFLSRMSHELRTPLNAVLGFGQLLKLDQLSTLQDEAVDLILNGGQHLLAMIDDVLDISLIETNQLEVSLEPVRVSEVIGETIALMSPLAAEARIRLSVGKIGPEAADYARADQRRLRQVLLNLLSNAIKYNTPGGTVEVTCTQADDRHLRITVTDTGMGIRAEDLPRLFTPFERLGQQTTTIEGTGIGLALSRNLTAIMGGRMDVTSIYGQGTTFTIELPVTDSPRARDIHNDTHEAHAGVAIASSTLLYIEDNVPNVRLVQRLIERRPGWQLVHACDGAQGLTLAHEVSPTLIMLDLHLPDMDGIDILQALRVDAHTASIPILVVSADANLHQVQRLKEAGAQYYLTKPLDITEVLTLLDKHSNQIHSAASR